MTNIIAQIQARANPTDDLLDIFSSTYKEKETEFKVDPLVLACSLKELVEKDQGYFQLDDPRVSENITDATREHAEVVRKYYTKKFFWTAFTDSRGLSDYRRRLINLLENRIRTCKDQDCGIYYKLPWFYEEDMIYDEFKLKYETKDLPRPTFSNVMKKELDVLELEYLKSTYSTQRKRKIERFWFTDQKYLFCIEVDRENILIDMFRAMLTKNVKLESRTSIDRIDQMYFYKLFKFNFVKDTHA